MFKRFSKIALLFFTFNFFNISFSISAVTKKFIFIYLISVFSINFILKKINNDNSKFNIKKLLNSLKDDISHLRNYYETNQKEILFKKINDKIEELNNSNYFFFNDSILLNINSKLFFSNLKMLTLAIILGLIPPSIFIKK